MWPKWLRRQYGKLEICGSSPGYDTNFSLKNYHKIINNRRPRIFLSQMGPTVGLEQWRRHIKGTSQKTSSSSEDPAERGETSQETSGSSDDSTERATDLWMEPETSRVPEAHWRCEGTTAQGPEAYWRPNTEPQGACPGANYASWKPTSHRPEGNASDPEIGEIQIY